GFGADLRIDLAVVDDVVAVQAARARLEKWRRVDMAHPEPREVRNQSSRVGEAKAFVQLQPVGGDGDAPRSEPGRVFGYGPLRHARGEALHPRVGLPALEAHRQLAAPVRMLA